MKFSTEKFVLAFNLSLLKFFYKSIKFSSVAKEGPYRIAKPSQISYYFVAQSFVTYLT